MIILRETELGQAAAATILQVSCPARAKAALGPDCVKTPSDGFLQRERCVRIGT